MPTRNEKVLIVMGADIALRASTKAKRHGISRSEYVRRLILADLEPLAKTPPGDMASSRPEAVADPWVEPTLDAEPFEDPA